MSGALVGDKRQCLLVGRWVPPTRDQVLPPPPHCDDSHSQCLSQATRPLKTSSLPVCPSLSLTSRPLSPKCPHLQCLLWHGLSLPLPIFPCQLPVPQTQLLQPPEAFPAPSAWDSLGAAHGLLHHAVSLMLGWGLPASASLPCSTEPGTQLMFDK